MADVTKITLPNGTTKDIKDATARKQANWNTNNGVKNLSPISGGTVASVGRVAKMPCNIPAGTYVMGWVSTATSGSAVITFYKNGTQIAQGGFTNSTSYSTTSITLTDTANEIELYTNTANTISDVMICPKSLYDADSTYQPYALPNTKITPELIELVDSGAKNLVNSTSGSGTRWIDMPVDIPAGEYAVSFATLSTTWEVSANQLQISFMDSNYDIVTDGYTYINYTTKNGVYKLNNTCKIIRLYASPTSVSGKVVTYTNMMLCTKAAWDVSQKFVPYRPPYEETVEQVAENETLGYLQNYNLSPIIGGHANSAGIIDRKDCFLSAGTYYVSWKTTSTASGTATMTFYDYNDTSVGQATITNSRTRTEVSVTLTDDCEAIELANNSNVFVSIIQVMITEMANQSFVPYAPSNAALYAMIQALQS